MMRCNKKHKCEGISDARLQGEQREHKCRTVNVVDTGNEGVVHESKERDSRDHTISCGAVTGADKSCSCRSSSFSSLSDDEEADDWSGVKDKVSTSGRS